MKIQDLHKDSCYFVQQDFADFYQNRFQQGEWLTFSEVHFLPYHEGYTVLFKEKTLYLQEEENSNILGTLGDYLRLTKE